MSVVSASYNTSTASSQMDNYNDNMETTKLKNYVKDLLKSQIFLGRYIERRFIDQRIGYRDIVLISAAEVDLKKDLLECYNKLKMVCANTTHIGILDAEALGLTSSGICLSTEIENQPFGPFWFQVKSIKFKAEEIIVTLKCLRHITDSYLEIEPILTGGAEKKLRDTKEAKHDNSAEILKETYTDIIGTLRGALSISNVKEFITFLFAFVIAIFTGSTAFVNFLGNFVLALLRELSLLIKNSTPMFLGLLDCFSKIVGGFYILLAMFFKPSNRVPNKRPIGYSSRQHRMTEPYDYKQID